MQPRVPRPQRHNWLVACRQPQPIRDGWIACKHLIDSGAPVQLDRRSGLMHPLRASSDLACLPIRPLWKGGNSTGTSPRNLKTGDATGDIVKRNSNQLNGSGGPRRLSSRVISRRSAARIRSKDQPTPTHLPYIELSGGPGTWPFDLGADADDAPTNLTPAFRRAGS